MTDSKSAESNLEVAPEPIAVTVGAMKSHGQYAWCPEGTYLTQFDLDQQDASIRPSAYDAPIVGRAGEVVDRGEEEEGVSRRGSGWSAAAKAPVGYDA